MNTIEIVREHVEASPRNPVVEWAIEPMQPLVIEQDVEAEVASIMGGAMTNGGIQKMNPVTSREDEILSLLQEECAEVIQAVSKIRRFGWDSYYPGQPEKINRLLLEEEIGDVREIMQIMVDFGLTDPFTVATRMDKKNEKLHRYTNIFDNEF